MKRMFYVLLILVLMVGALTFVGCGNDNESDVVVTSENTLAKIAEWNSQQNIDESRIVGFELYIDGCSCSKHSSFDITWNSPAVKADVLSQVLVSADEQGLLLCDCHEGGKSDLSSVVASIEPLFRDGYPGLRIKLKEEIWLYKQDITEKLEPLFASHDAELFGERYFKIF